MPADPPSQTLTVGAVQRKHGARHLVVLRGEHTETIDLPRGAELVFGRTHDADVRIDDRTLSRRHLKVCVGKTVRVTDLDSHNGTRLRGQALRPGTPVELLSGDVLEAGNTTFVFRDELPTAEPTDGGAWAQARALARRVQKTSLNVMLVGPAGSGRRTMAAEILGDPHHTIDARALDNAGLDALEHMQGSLRLLHCDETPQALQAPLTRMLEAGRRRVAATSTRDTGVLAARLDFYLPLHRALSGVVLQLPSLETCKDEFDAIAEHLLRGWARRTGASGVPRLSAGALEVLRARAWPGELRALAATLEASVLDLRNPTIGPADLRLPREVVRTGDPKAVERQRILDALAACGGNQTQAAKLLKISRRTLVSRLDEYGIARPRKRASRTKS